MIEWFLSLPLLEEVGIVYGIVITIVTFFAFGIDKMKSELDVHRTSEKTLWVLSALGGSVGGLLGMNFFRHKTKKTSFQAGMIVIVAMQICLVVWLLER